MKLHNRNCATCKDLPHDKDGKCTGFFSPCFCDKLCSCHTQPASAEIKCACIRAGYKEHCLACTVTGKCLCGIPREAGISSAVPNAPSGSFRALQQQGAVEFEEKFVLQKIEGTMPFIVNLSPMKDFIAQRERAVLDWVLGVVESKGKDVNKKYDWEHTPWGTEEFVRGKGWGYLEALEEIKSALSGDSGTK